LFNIFVIVRPPDIGMSESLKVYCPTFYRTASMQDGLSHERNVRPSVCLWNAWIVTKQKKHVPKFLYRMKDHSS